MASKPPLFVRKATGLTREISVLATIPLSWLCIGAGINLFSVQASFSFPGANVSLGYFLCGIFYVIFTTCLGFMAVAMPRTGGDYVSTGRILGPFAGIFSGIPRIIGLAFIGGLLGGVTGILAGVGFLQAGTLVNNATWIDWGLWILQNKEVQFGIGILLILISFLILMFGSKTFVWATWLLVIIPAIGSIVSMVLLYTNTPATAQTAWDSMFGSGAWSEIENVAIDNGWTANAYGIGVDWSSTFKILIPAYFAYGGSEATVYWGSEVKEPRKSMLVGTVVGPLLMWVFYTVFVHSVYYCYGNFVSQCAFVMMQEDVAAQLSRTLTPVIPEIGFPAFVSVFAREPWLVFFVSLTSALWIFGVCVLIMGMVSKLIFAMSFDRFVPERLASVNDRFHSPHWALAVTFIVAIIGLLIYLYYGALAAIIDTTIIWFFWSMLLCVAATIFPFRRREIWEKGYAIRVGVPLISILGIISFVVYAYVNVTAIWEAAAKNLDILFIAFGTWIFALIYYLAYATYNKGRGIDVNAIYKEIPPA